jgi:hypothetical protein
MNPTEVIEMYIGDTVRYLPRRQRQDVAAELRSLLNEELRAQAQKSGRPADESMALGLVRGYGQPNEAAARYQRPWAIIDPADSTSFVRAAIVGAGALVLLSAISQRMPSLSATAEDMVKIGVLVWLGVLVVAFGVKNGVRRLWPAAARWEPRDRDRANRVGTAVVVPIATFCVVLYAAPAWVLDQISGGRFVTSWAAYTADFSRLRLPCFIGLMVALLTLLTLVAIEGRWRRLTRRINIGLNLAVACLVLLFAVDGGIFQSSPVDQIARNVLALVAMIYLPSVGVQLYNEIGRLDRATAIAAKQA